MAMRRVHLVSRGCRGSGWARRDGPSSTYLRVEDRRGLVGVMPCEVVDLHDRLRNGLVCAVRPNAQTHAHAAVQSKRTGAHVRRAALRKAAGARHTAGNVAHSRQRSARHAALRTTCSVQCNRRVDRGRARHEHDGSAAPTVTRQTIQIQYGAIPSNERKEKPGWLRLSLAGCAQHRRTNAQRGRITDKGKSSRSVAPLWSHAMLAMPATTLLPVLWQIVCCTQGCCMLHIFRAACCTLACRPLPLQSHNAPDCRKHTDCLMRAATAA
jgi:hypothetical protein